jgi:hypothetical protein
MVHYDKTQNPLELILNRRSGDHIHIEL